MSSPDSSSRSSSRRSRDPEATRSALVEATVELILRQGFAATSVGQVCQQAGVTKGSFFHHFESKDAIGRAAIEWWGNFGTALYEQAWNDSARDPLEQMADLFSIMEGFTMDESRVCTCVVGIMSQEAAQSNEHLREMAARELERWTDNTRRLIAAAKEKHCPDAGFEPEAVAWHLNAVWQGSMLIGKTIRNPAVIRQNLSLSREWLAGLFPDEVRPLLFSKQTN